MKNALLTRLTQEIEEIDSQIKLLWIKREKLSVKLNRAELYSSLSTDVKRKNGLYKKLVEVAVLNQLTSSGSPVASNALYNSCLKVVPTLKENTFRSHLNRLKGLGKIQSAQRGFYSLRST